MGIGLGIKLRQLRADRGWSQTELARRTGLNRSYLANIEAGTIDKPSADTFLKLARAFTILPEELYEAAGYIRGVLPLLPHRESPEELLNRLRQATPASIPVYTEFPVHAGGLMQPVEYIYRARPGANKQNIEGYIVHGRSLEPGIRDGDIIVVDRDGAIDNGDIVACLSDDRFLIGQLQSIRGELWIENNEGRTKLEECEVSAVVIEVIRRLK